jgi:hypothetical protein
MSAPLATDGAQPNAAALVVAVTGQLAMGALLAADGAQRLATALVAVTGQLA